MFSVGLVNGVVSSQQAGRVCVRRWARRGSSAGVSTIGLLLWVVLVVFLATLLATRGRSKNSATKTAAADGRPVTKISGGGPELAGPIPPIAAGAQDQFEDQAEKCGLTFTHQLCDSRIANIIESNGSGAAWMDFDNDGWLDVYLVNSGPLAGVTHEAPGTARRPNRLYRNLGNGSFADVTEKAGVAGAGYGVAVVAADYDNDGFVDLYVVNVGRSILYRNRGDGTFVDVTDKAGVANAGGTGLGAVFFDADNDGWLDLFVANYLTFDPSNKLYFSPDGYPGPLSYQGQLNVLYRNRGDGTFEDASESSGVRIPGHRAMSVAAFDFNGDGFADLYISNDASPNLLLQNDGKGHFRDVAQTAGVAFNAMGEAAGSMAASVGDCNMDGLQDLLVTRLGYGSLYVGSRQGLYEDRLMASGIGAITAQFVGWGSAFMDYDNDGDLDVIIVNGDAHYLVGWQSLLLENQGDGKFQDASERGGTYFKTRINGRGCAPADYNNDGLVDVLVTTMNGRAILLKNRGPAGHWLTVDLQGTKSNRDGYGAVVTVVAGGKRFRLESHCPTGFLSQGDRRLHFGLGTADRAERIDIRWPSGTEQSLADVPLGQVLKVRESSEKAGGHP